MSANTPLLFKLLNWWCFVTESIGNPYGVILDEYCNFNVFKNRCISFTLHPLLPKRERNTAAPDRPGEARRVMAGGNIVSKDKESRTKKGEEKLPAAPQILHRGCDYIVEEGAANSLPLPQEIQIAPFHLIRRVVM